MSETNMKARLGISGSFDCKDAEGNILKTITFSGTLPLTDEQAEELAKELENGTDNRE